jgi:hypothetical protein
VGRRERPSKIPVVRPARIQCNPKRGPTGSLGGGVCHTCGEMLEPVEGSELGGSAVYPTKCPVCGGPVDP